MTRRCYLRDYSEEDREFFVALNLDAKAREHMNGPLSEAEANALFDQALTDTRPHQGFRWAIHDRKLDDYIGHFFATPWETPDSMEWAIILRPACWGRGLATEVAVATLEHSFQNLPYSRMVATVGANHPAGHRLLQGLGMSRLEACRDDHGVYYLYTSTKDQFLARLPELQKDLWPNNRPSVRRKTIAAIQAELAMLEAQAQPS